MGIQTNIQIHDYIDTLRKSNPNVIELMNRSKVFWNLLNYDMPAIALADLCKIYDNSKDANGIYKIVEIFEENQELLKNAKSLDAAQEKLVALKNLAGKLKRYRNKIVAHYDKSTMLDKTAFFSDLDLSWLEISELIDEAEAICILLNEALFEQKLDFDLLDITGVDRLFQYAEIGYKQTSISNWHYC